MDQGRLHAQRGLVSTIEVIPRLVPERNGARFGLSAEELQALYAELPSIDCQMKCQSYCSKIAVSVEEFDILAEAAGFEPHGDPGCDTCPLLGEDGLCTVHEVRPMICRLWGLTETMQCPWGCKPSPRYLTEEECYSYLLRAGTYGMAFPKEVADEIAHDHFGNRSAKSPLSLLL